MTDEHGPDSEPAHEDVSQDAPQDTPQDVPQEEEAPQPVEAAEAWSDDHPPVDDFSDAGTAGEETATVSEEAAEEEGVAQSVPPSRSMLPLFAGIGGILLIGAVIYWQFGHSSPPPMLAMQTQAPKSASSLQPSSKPASIPPSSSDKVAESDITGLYKAPPEPAAPSIPSPSSSAETSPTTAMPAPPPAATPAPAMSGTVPPANPLAEINQASPPAPMVNVRIDTLAASVDALQKSVETTAQGVNKLSTMMAANQAMPPVSSQVSPALEDRLNKIEQSLLQIEHNEAAKPPPPVTATNETEATSEVVTKPVSRHKKPVKHKREHNAHKKIVHHIVRSPSPASAPTFPEPARLSSSWVLRAATPGEAWVASDAHTTELKHVQVGDSLQGIGTIRAIRQTPGGWEVEGATGTIR